MIERLQQQLKKIKKYIDNGDQKAPSVSDKGIYWQLDHTLNVITGITQVLSESNQTDYHPKNNFFKWVIMTTGYIPRGKGRAPKETISEVAIHKEELMNSYQLALESVDKLPVLPKDKTFKHPLFGWLRLEQTIKFMGIHTHHHLKIIRDITKKNS